MRATLPAPEQSQSLGEEIANSLSHGVGAVAALIAVPILLVTAARRGDAANVIGAALFAGTMVLLYLASTLYHALSRTKAHRLFRLLDHGAIFLLIAGTYTPFTLGVLRGAWGWTLFGSIWGLAISGIILKTTDAGWHPWLSTCLYLGMGWLGLVAARPLWLHVPLSGLLWLLAGGCAYTVGVGFYSVKGVRYSHFVWHCFVLAGTSCHCLAVLWYAA